MQLQLPSPHFFLILDPSCRILLTAIYWAQPFSSLTNIVHEANNCQNVLWFDVPVNFQFLRSCEISMILFHGRRKLLVPVGLRSTTASSASSASKYRSVVTSKSFIRTRTQTACWFCKTLGTCRIRGLAST